MLCSFLQRALRKSPFPSFMLEPNPTGFGLTVEACWSQKLGDTLRLVSSCFLSSFFFGLFFASRFSKTVAMRRWIFWGAATNALGSFCDLCSPGIHQCHLGHDGISRVVSDGSLGALQPDMWSAWDSKPFFWGFTTIFLVGTGLEAEWDTWERVGLGWGYSTIYKQVHSEYNNKKYIQIPYLIYPEWLLCWVGQQLPLANCWEIGHRFFLVVIILELAIVESAMMYIYIHKM